MVQWFACSVFYKFGSYCSGAIVGAVFGNVMVSNHPD